MEKNQNYVTWIQKALYYTKDVETRFDTSNNELGRSLSKGKNKKVIGLMRDELSIK